MPSAAKYTVADADRYRLRMLYGQWYLFLYQGEQSLGAIGPWDSKQAQREAKVLDGLGLKDWDKLDG